MPISFLEGQIGKLFVEFGFVMAGAVAISTLVALTLCPALASRLLKVNRVERTTIDPAIAACCGFTGWCSSGPSMFRSW